VRFIKVDMKTVNLVKNEKSKAASASVKHLAANVVAFGLDILMICLFLQTTVELFFLFFYFNSYMLVSHVWLFRI
jgi:tryptophanyl-tRNA synthetase